MKTETLIVVYISLHICAGCRLYSPGVESQGNSPSMVLEAPEGDNNLKWWDINTMVYNDMPEIYLTPKMPWAGNYWPTFRGGIGYRWRQPIVSTDYRDFIYQIPSAAQLASMSDQQIDALSPAEKYDLWMGRSELTGSETITGRQRSFMLKSATYNRESLGNDEIPEWTGICNGWSVASIYEPYPEKSVTVQNPQGRFITFYPADIQALISQIYFDYQPSINIVRLGSLCDETFPAKDSQGRQINPACRDVNPMSFHIALGRHLAKGKPFVFDVEPTVITLNQPAYGYLLTYSNKRDIPPTYLNRTPEAKKLVDVHTLLFYLAEVGAGEIGWTQSQMNGLVRKAAYDYTLELDANEKIVGGEWKNGSSLPDFLWYPEALPTDEILKRNDPSYPLSMAKLKILVSSSAN